MQFSAWWSVCCLTSSAHLPSESASLVQLWKPSLNMTSNEQEIEYDILERELLNGVDSGLMQLGSDETDEAKRTMVLQFRRSHYSELLGMTDEEVLRQQVSSLPGMCRGQLEFAPVHKPFRKLELIHIPRTGGTTIEDCSRLEESVDRRWGMWQDHLREDGDPKYCVKQHTPPNLVPYYKGKETFCVVRDPYTRLISQWGYMCGQNWQKWGQHGDSVKLMNEKLLEALQRVRDHRPSDYDCHFLPQAAYVWGWDLATFTVDKSKKHCDNVLHFEDGLSTTFNELMEEHGYKYRMTNKSLGTRSNNKFDVLKPENLSAEVVKLYNELVAVDFELLGFAKRSTR